ncbi:MAG: type VI secretion system baseplate subunit TssE [candidate division Zixibacteria bacterium]|nr:type VI secretion system baseplate subunit TssE [candidate division Zixibacteria bacterium]
MINDRTLFERLAAPTPQGGHVTRLDVARLRRSVLSHLRNMLNSRHGHAPAQPDYGIPDLNEFMYAFPESKEPMRQAIQTSIEKYEPRLKNVRATWVPDEDDPLNIRFEITARLVTDDKDVPVSFTTNVGSVAGIEVVE